jgi:hypothetical protein
MKKIFLILTLMLSLIVSSQNQILDEVKAPNGALKVLTLNSDGVVQFRDISALITNLTPPDYPLIVINSVTAMAGPDELYSNMVYTNNSGLELALLVSSDNVNFYPYINLPTTSGVQTKILSDRFKYHKLQLINNPCIASNVFEIENYSAPEFPFNFQLGSDFTKLNVVALQDITIVLGSKVISVMSNGEYDFIESYQPVTYHTGQSFVLTNPYGDQYEDTSYSLINVMSPEYAASVGRRRWIY